MTQHRFSHDNRYCLFYTKDTGTITGVVVDNFDMGIVHCYSADEQFNTVDDFITSIMNDYFSFLTGGVVKDISRRITVKSMRSAWDYIDEHDIEIVV